MVDPADQEKRPTLRDDTRSRTRNRIVEGARVVVAGSGLGFTIDEVAAQAGVSRRTVFRYFATHDDLVAEIFRETSRAILELVPTAFAPEGDLEDWLAVAMARVHSFIRTFIGRAFWDAYGDRVELSPGTQAELTKVLEQRRMFSGQTAAAAWSASGGAGDPPAWVRDAFEVHASGFTTFALPTQSPEELGVLSARILGAVLAAALVDADSGHAP